MTERKTERAKQLLVRYIRDRQMTTGDKLPPQNELRRIFHYGAATVSSAINALKQDGVLEVRDKVGVFVADPEAGGHAGRVIGITMLYGENNFYYSCLLASLQQARRIISISTTRARRLFPESKSTVKAGICLRVRKACDECSN